MKKNAETNSKGPLPGRQAGTSSRQQPLSSRSTAGEPSAYIIRGTQA